MKSREEQIIKSTLDKIAQFGTGSVRFDAADIEHIFRIALNHTQAAQENTVKSAMQFLTDSKRIDQTLPEIMVAYAAQFISEVTPNT